MLAAHRAGIRQVCLPEGNRRDLKEIPAEVLEEMEVRFTNDARQNIEAALLPIFLPSGQIEPPPIAPLEGDPPRTQPFGA